MNRRKKWIIAAVILLGAGVLICGITFAAAGFDFKKLGSADYETNTYEIREEFKNISVKAGTDDIIFKPSEDGRCTVVCHEKETEKHEVKVEDGTLKITGKDILNWFNFNLFDFDGPSVTVYLPEKEYGSLAVNAGTGGLQVPEGLTFDDIHAEISTGSVQCGASAKNAVEIKASTGDIRAENMSAGDIILSVSTGSIKAASLNSSGKVDVHVTTGEAKLEAVTCKDLYSDGSTGDLIMKDVTASGQFHLERTTGDILFEACDAGEIYAKASTGDVRGTLLSDKVYLTSTATGDVDVPQTVEGGKCEIKTSTGDIRISVTAQ